MEMPLKRVWIGLFIIMGCVGITYSNVYHAPFVFDDLPRISDNGEIENLFSAISLKELVKPRGIVVATFALNYLKR